MTNKFAARLSVVIMLVISIAITLKTTAVSEKESAELASSDVVEVIILDAELTQVESSTEVTQAEPATEVTQVESSIKYDPIVYYAMSDEEVELFAKLVYLESGSTSADCQRAVASVVLNRITTQNSDLRSVIYAKGQFAVASKLSNAKYSAESMNAVKYVLLNGPTVPEYVTYFREGHYFNWGPDHKGYTNIDNVYFSYSIKLQQSIEC